MFRTRLCKTYKQGSYVIFKLRDVLHSVISKCKIFKTLNKRRENVNCIDISHLKETRKRILF